jgi:predicted membrane-bound dolichyl-phosphate-mannose-protein mannosyltransferase
MIGVNETELVGILGYSDIHVISGNARALRIYVCTEHPFLIDKIEQLVVSVQSLPFRRLQNIFEGKLTRSRQRRTAA